MTTRAAAIGAGWRALRGRHARATAPIAASARHAARRRFGRRLAACMTAGLVVGAAAGCTGGGVPSAGGARIANGTPFTLTIERRYQGAWLGLLMLDPGTTGSIALQGGECRSDLVAITGVLVVVARHPTPLCAGDTWAIDSAASPEATLEP